MERLSAGISMYIPVFSTITEKYEDYSDGIAEDETDLSGNFCTLGFGWKVNDKATLGLRIRSEIELHERTTDMDGYNDRGCLIIPPEYGLALELKPGDQINIYVEYLTRQLGDYKYMNGYNYQFYNGLSDNGFAFRSGVEYGKKIKFRGGILAQSVPRYKIVDGAYEEAPQTEYGFTGGLGIPLNSNLTFNLFGGYSILNYDYEGNYVIGEEPYTVGYNYEMLRIGFSFGMYIN
jgi:hypothetical protein